MCVHVAEVPNRNKEGVNACRRSFDAKPAMHATMWDCYDADGSNLQLGVKANFLSGQMRANG